MLRSQIWAESSRDRSEPPSGQIVVDLREDLPRLPRGILGQVVGSQAAEKQQVCMSQPRATCAHWHRIVQSSLCALLLGRAYQDRGRPQAKTSALDGHEPCRR